MFEQIINVAKITFWAIFFRQKYLLRFIRTYRKVTDLKLFERSFYRSQLAHDLPGWIDPLAHCLSQSASNFSNPNALFNSKYYLAQNPAILNLEINLLSHFVLEGIANNRSPHSLIDINFYTKAYPDVLTEFEESPLQHLLKYGLNENRQTHVLVDCDYYLKNNPDVAELGLNPLVHFLEKGGFEGRNPHLLFDCDYYLKNNPDVAELGLNPLVHFLEKGGFEGKDTVRLFDSAFYLRKYEDVKKHGVVPLIHFLKLGIYEGRLPSNLYPEWIEANEKSSCHNDQSEMPRSLISNPLISIIMPVFNTDIQWLEKAIDSVRNQTYPHWELCIADDGSTLKAVRPTLEKYERLDSRIRVVYRPQSGHISVASNSALGLASGEYIGLLDHDDELAQNALFEVALTINQHPDADLIYSDEDKITPTGIRFNPFFKPDWAPERLLSHMYCGHLGIYRTTIVRQIGGFREGYHGSQDYDLCLRFTEQSDKVYHIPKILYHWRTLQESTAANPDSKSYAYDAAQKALQDALDRRATNARVSPISWKVAPGLFRVKYPLNDRPRVSIIIVDPFAKDDFRGMVNSIQSLVSKTAYNNLEIVICTSMATSQDLLRTKLDQGLGEKSEVLIASAKTDQFSELVNSGVSKATGTFIALFDPNLTMCTSQWIQNMVGKAQQPGVGVIGPKLMTHDNFVYSAGLILRNNASPMHSHEGHPKNSPGYFGQLYAACNSSALSTHCLVMSRDIFEQVGKFDEHLSPPWVEADFCLDLSQKGYRHIFEPDVIAKFKAPYNSNIDHDTDTDNEDRCLSIIKERWPKAMADDPLYSPHLLRQSGGYRLNNYPKIFHSLVQVRSGVTAEHC
jgi:O-antigen biosynthesis protein